MSIFARNAFGSNCRSVFGLKNDSSNEAIMLHIPAIQPVGICASEKEKREAYIRYCVLLAELNPSRFLPVGVKKRWWHLFKTEHPLTRIRTVQGSEW